MSSPQQSELRVCLSTPKLGTLAFFLIFMILIPVTLITSNNTEYIQYYLPFTVLLASTLTAAGAPNNFQDLYPLFPTSIMGFLSANSGFAVQNDGTYLPRITRETCNLN
jgi:hypothetical protein